MKLDMSTVYRSNHAFIAVDEHTGEDTIVSEMFPMECWDCPEAFKFAGIRGYEPMTAKELETEEQQDEKLNDPSYILEEKFDGTRALVYFLSQQDLTGEELGFCRVFSRRISKKTGFYVENSDSLPQIRDIDVPEMSGTILDGEMFIDGLPFKEVSSTLNCLWDKAIDRQIEKGFISFHAFDILFYHGIDLRKMPLERRKYYLHLAVEEADSEYIKEVRYFDCGSVINNTTLNHEIELRLDPKWVDDFIDSLEDDKNTYPHLYECWSEGKGRITPRAYYELIVATGGEGLIVKPKNGKYQHKRGWEYSKIKKFLTREMVVIGFSEPTKEYTGKDVRKWGFWVEKDTDKRVIGNFYGDKKYIPVTKFYYYNQIGNLLLGVLISVEEFNKLPKNKRGTVRMPSHVCPDLKDYDISHFIMEVCECAGFDDETREYFTRNRDKMMGTVVEVKSNELFRDSGKMRHPRYMRQRFDKNPEQCTWEDHIGNSEVTK